MEMKKINTGRLRAIGYEARARGCRSSDIGTAASSSPVAARLARAGDTLFVSEQMIPDIRGILAASSG